MTTQAPTLKELKTRDCSLAELQAAIVDLIRLHNELVADISELKLSGRIRSKLEARENVRYGL